MTVTSLHPPISETKVIHDPTVDGELLINIAGVVALVKEGETPQSRHLYRLYLREYRALEGQPLAHEKREESAMLAAFQKYGLNVVEMEKQR